MGPISQLQEENYPRQEISHERHVSFPSLLTEMIMFNFPIPSSSHLVSLSFFVHRSLNYSMDTITWNSAILRRGIPSHATRVHDSTAKLRTSLISPPSSKISLSNSQSQQKPRRFRSHGATVRRPEVTCGVRQIDDSQFSDVVLKSDRPVLVEFVASWCGPCRLMAPAIDWLAQEYEDRIRVVKIDHDANPGLIEKYKVYGLPNFMVFKNGAEIPGSRREGAITKAKLKEYIDQLLVDSVSVT